MRLSNQTTDTSEISDILNFQVSPDYSHSSFLSPHSSFIRSFEEKDNARDQTDNNEYSENDKEETVEDKA